MDSRIQQAISFMKENLSCKLAEKELAHQAGLTAQHFCVLFKAETSETPARYVNHLRMEKARELLESTENLQLSIKEIAARVGCGDLSPSFGILRSGSVYHPGVTEQGKASQLARS